MNQYVATTRVGGVTRVTLARPDKLNALDPVMLDGLETAFRDVVADPEVRAVVLTGEGRAFCAGADLAALGPMLEDVGTFGAFLSRWNVVFDLIEECPLPVVAAVNGIALAGGFELTHLCDVVVLGDDVTIGDQHATYGLFPAGGGVQRLARLVGPRRASWLLMSGERLTADQALAWGLATDVVPTAEVLARAHEMADLLAARSSGLSERIKRGIREDLTRPAREAMAIERPSAVAHMMSPDAREGIEAFRQRRQPRFHPRRPATGPEGFDERHGQDA